MKLEELKFRYYNGEKECPFDENEQSKRRWWDQERSAAFRHELILADFDSREDRKLPSELSDEKIPDDERAIPISGYLNTRQWGAVSSDFYGFFDAPVNGFRLTDENISKIDAAQF